VVGSSLKWLATSNEHTNFTYDLSPRNREHLTWWVSAVSGAPVDAVRGYLAEIEADEDLRQHIEAGVKRSDRRGLADPQARYGRRLGWYALTRVLRPQHIVETGTDKGLGACVFAAAVLRNGTGTVTTMDFNPDSGYLVSGRYAEVTNRLLGDSVELLHSLDSPVDLFLHDSWHTFEHETAELEAVGPLLTSRSLVLSDNSHATDALVRWAEARDRRFLFFAEQPEDHWYPGSGIGAAWSDASYS
jgi:predicted O-methyltransferase YrrM